MRAHMNQKCNLQFGLHLRKTRQPVIHLKRSDDDMFIETNWLQCREEGESSKMKLMERELNKGARGQRKDDA